MLETRAGNANLIAIARRRKKESGYTRDHGSCNHKRIIIKSITVEATIREGRKENDADGGRPGSLPLKTLSRTREEGSRESIKRYLAFLNGTWPIEWHFEGVGKGARGSNKWKETKQGGGIRDVGATSDSGVESEGLPRWPPLFYSSSSLSLQFLSSWLLFRVLVIAWSGSSLSK